MSDGSDYDVLIAGGGMVGAALACALGGSRLRVGVLESQAPGEDAGKGGWDLRVSAITAATQHFFHNVGAWADMTSRRTSPYREMQVWDARGDGCIHFDSADVGLPYLGHIVENAVIQSALWARLAQFDNVTRMCPALLADMRVGRDVTEVRLDDGRVLRARLLVGADGARSRVREWGGISVRGWDYEQHALVTTVRTGQPHRETAWQRFLSDGPLAFLPLCDGRCSIVWSTAPARAARLLRMDAAEFEAELGLAFDHSLGAIVESGPRAVFPLRLQHATEYVRPRLALIGDAAHTVHPLAGQGVNLGLLDAAALAEVLLDGGARDPGGHPLLRKYERARKGHNLLMLGAMDGFKRLFGTDSAPVVWARNTGLALTDAAGPLKTLLVERAMGLGGELPRLARGPFGALV